MSLVNWISLIIPIVLLLVGTIIFAYFRKKANNLDGFMGIVVLEEEEM